MRQRPALIAAIASALIAVLVVVFVVLPKMSEVGERQDDLQAAQDQESTLLVQLAALQDAQAAAPETQREIESIEDQIPPTADLPALFRLLQSAADRSAVDFFAFSPGTPTPDVSGRAFSVIPSTITVTGGYFAMDEFLFLLETLPRAAKVTSVVVTPGGEVDVTGAAASSSLSMQLTVEFYTIDTSSGPGSVPGPTGAGGSVAPTTPTGATGAAETTGPTGTTGEAAGETP